MPHSAIWLHENGNFSIFSSFPPSFSLLHWLTLFYMEGLSPDLLDVLVLLFLWPLTSFHIFLVSGLALPLQHSCLGKLLTPSLIVTQVLF